MTIRRQRQSLGEMSDLDPKLAPMKEKGRGKMLAWRAFSPKPSGRPAAKVGC